MMVLLISSLLSTAVPHPSSTPSLVGATLAEAQQTEFFTFFHFAETERALDSTGRGWVQFRPGGEHRTQVRLWLLLTAAGTTEQATIDLARGFIQPPQTQVFARDVAKSFLYGAVPAADQNAIGFLAETIWRDRDPSRFNASVAGSNRDSRVVAGYRAFLGLTETYYEVLSAVWIRFKNQVVDETQILRISVGKN